MIIFLNGVGAVFDGAIDIPDIEEEEDDIEGAIEKISPIFIAGGEVMEEYGKSNTLIAIRDSILIGSLNFEVTSFIFPLSFA